MNFKTRSRQKKPSSEYFPILKDGPLYLFYFIIIFSFSAASKGTSNRPGNPYGGDRQMRQSDTAVWLCAAFSSNTFPSVPYPPAFPKKLS